MLRRLWLSLMDWVEPPTELDPEYVLDESTRQACRTQPRPALLALAESREPETTRRADDRAVRRPAA